MVQKYYFQDLYLIYVANYFQCLAKAFRAVKERSLGEISCVARGINDRQW